jgi:hypothetical protein
VRVEANNLTVNDRALRGQFGQGFFKNSKLRLRWFRRNDLALAVVQIHHGPEAVVL